MGGSTAVWWSADGQLVVSNRGVWWVGPRPCGGQLMVSCVWDQADQSCSGQGVSDNTILTLFGGGGSLTI